MRKQLIRDKKGAEEKKRNGEERKGRKRSESRKEEGKGKERNGKERKTGETKRKKTYKQNLFETKEAEGEIGGEGKGFGNILTRTRIHVYGISQYSGITDSCIMVSRENGDAHNITRLYLSGTYSIHKPHENQASNCYHAAQKKEGTASETGRKKSEK